MSKPTTEYVRSIFHYDPLSGIFTRLVSVNSRAREGDVVGTLDASGYLVVKIGGRSYKVHRLAHLYMTGHHPDDQIDHINGVRTDNRWSNLRPATQQQNGMNTKKRNDNVSGFKGVHWNKCKNKWRVQIQISGKKYHLGYFSTPEEAFAHYEGGATILFGQYKRTPRNNREAA